MAEPVPTRIRKTNIEALISSTRRYTLYPKQYFYETGKAYEIWDETGLPRMIKRISKKYILWVIEKE